MAARHRGLPSDGGASGREASIVRLGRRVVGLGGEREVGVKDFGGRGRPLLLEAAHENVVGNFLVLRFLRSQLLESGVGFQGS